MRPAIIGTCIALCVTAGGAARQERPDFSGRWERVEKEAPATAADVIVVRQTGGSSQTTSATRVSMTAQLVTNLQVERFFGTRMEPARYLVTDVGSVLSSGFVAGSTTGVSVQSESSSTAAKWEPAGLVIGRATFVGEPEQRPASERYELWQLGGDGILTITIGERSNGGEMRTTKVTYRRGAR